MECNAYTHALRFITSYATTLVHRSKNNYLLLTDVYFNMLFEAIFVNTSLNCLSKSDVYVLYSYVDCFSNGPKHKYIEDSR